MAKRDKFNDETQSEQTESTATETTQASETSAAPSTEAPKQIKSIVPSKYAGKYKNGGDDALATFIKEQCTVDGKFDFDKFFELCAKNGIPQTEVDKYKTQVDAKIGGAAGRARMTLRNRLTPVARKGEGMVGLDGEKYDVKLPPAPSRVKAETEASATENAAA
jgi:hypothetical protein